MTMGIEMLGFRLISYQLFMLKNLYIHKLFIYSEYLLYTIINYSIKIKQYTSNQILIDFQAFDNILVYIYILSDKITIQVGSIMLILNCHDGQRAVCEMSKGSKYFEEEGKKEALTRQKIENMRAQCAQLSSADIYLPLSNSKAQESLINACGFSFIPLAIYIVDDAL